MVVNYYTADTHFYHKNIVKMENRPFKDVEEMNAFLINQWNSQVTNEDTVYHIGDFALATFNKTVEILEQLNGNKVIVGGNHDEDKIWLRIINERPDLIKDFIPVGFKEKWGKDWVWFSHFPMSIGLRQDKWNVHGHIHSSESPFLNQINVGVDSPHFKNLPFGRLLTQEDIIEVMGTKRAKIEVYTHK